MAGDKKLRRWVSPLEKLRKEARLHTSDIIYGAPLPLGGITIAMHAANCERCSYLARKAALAKVSR